MNDWQEHSTQFWQAEQEDTLIGKITGTRNTQYGEAVKVVKDNGDTVLVNYTVINDVLQDHVGMKVKLVCNGMTKSESGRDYMDFNVYFKKSESQ